MSGKRRWLPMRMLRDWRRLHVLTLSAELEPDTLAERLQDELRAANGIIISPPLIGAWARLPE